MRLEPLLLIIIIIMEARASYNYYEQGLSLFLLWQLWWSAALVFNGYRRLWSAAVCCGDIVGYGQLHTVTSSPICRVGLSTQAL
jgi:hypothetical protein